MLVFRTFLPDKLDKSFTFLSFSSMISLFGKNSVIIINFKIYLICFSIFWFRKELYNIIIIYNFQFQCDACAQSCYDELCVLNCMRKKERFFCSTGHAHLMISRAPVGGWTKGGHFRNRVGFSCGGVCAD